jgi:hypothetical protein
VCCVVLFGERHGVQYLVMLVLHGEACSSTAHNTAQHRVGCSCIPYSTWRPYSAHPTATPSSPGPGGTKVFSKPSSLDIRPLSTLGGEEEGKDERRGRGRGEGRTGNEEGGDEGERRERILIREEKGEGEKRVGKEGGREGKRDRVREDGRVKIDGGCKTK